MPCRVYRHQRLDALSRGSSHRKACSLVGAQQLDGACMAPVSTQSTGHGLGKGRGLEPHVRAKLRGLALL
eukprot:870592-Lingulodinium_polyedra.AAC.1